MKTDGKQMERTYLYFHLPFFCVYFVLQVKVVLISVLFGATAST
jgi:hypothetical protein